MTYTYDRLGRRTQVQQGSNTTVFELNAAGLLLRETNSAGSLLGVTITNNWDNYLLRTSLTLFPTNGASAFVTSFDYDAASRLSGVTNGNVSAGYGYLANSALISTLTFKQSGTTRMTTTRQHDFLNRLVSISSVPSASSQPPVSYTYQYDAANQRRRVDLADGSYWAYDYDPLGQVIAGKRYWPEGVPVPGQQFQYGFDDIGNRTQVKSGGDQSGGSLRSASYTNNVLNQITGRDVPAGFDVLGLAHPQATVKVNGSNADYRHEDYFQKALTVSNGSTSVWQTVSVTATNSGSSSTWPTGYVFVPRAPEVFAYDGDGNLTSDGRWTYTWDGENRLLSMVSLTNTPTESKRKLEFAYDYQGRRISKRVSCYTNSTWQVTVSNLFVYDGWNLIGELNATNRALIRGYVWGLDLSGSMQGAGGVGGLLCEVPAGNNPQVLAYDGNGNVAALVDATSGSLEANYEYGPFGECIRASDSAAKGSPLQFSTKYRDEESNLLFAGHRYYNSSFGRWLSRDILGEAGGDALYVFAANRPVVAVDPLGLSVSFFLMTPVPSDQIRYIRNDEGVVEPSYGESKFHEIKIRARAQKMYGLNCYAIVLEGKAVFEFWYYTGPGPKGIVPWNHEWRHMQIGREFVEKLNSEGNRLVDYSLRNCMSESQAKCYANVIANEMYVLYGLYYQLRQAELDCSEYQYGPSCRDAAKIPPLHTAAYIRLLWKLSVCSLIPDVVRETDWGKFGLPGKGVNTHAE